MTDHNCGNCFFSFVPPSAAGNEYAGKLTCNRNAPAANPQGALWLWPLVHSDFWCGSGIDASSRAPFNQPQATTTVSGTFVMTNVPAMTVTQAACLPTSTIKIWVVDAQGSTDAPGPIIGTPSNGSFTAATASGLPVGVTCGYTVYNN